MKSFEVIHCVFYPPFPPGWGRSTLRASRPSTFCGSTSPCTSSAGPSCAATSPRRGSSRPRAPTTSTWPCCWSSCSCPRCPPSTPSSPSRPPSTAAPSGGTSHWFHQDGGGCDGEHWSQSGLGLGFYYCHSAFVSATTLGALAHQHLQFPSFSCI